MERALLESLQLHLDSAGADIDFRRLVQVLSSARSLLVNPDSSESTRRSVVDALLRSLRSHADEPAFLRPALKVLGDAAVLFSSLSPSVVSAILPLLDRGDSLVADAVAVLASVVEAQGADGEVGARGGGGLSLIASALYSDRVLSRASSPIVAVRSRIIDFLVQSAEKGECGKLFGDHLMIQVFLVLSGDLYPLVRRSAVDGMVAWLRKAGGGIDSLVVECFYDRAVFLLKDEEEAVRLASVKLISECGEIFACNHQGSEHSEQMDLIFVQLSSMARDMCMKVRYEAFIALGRVKLVRENVLLQSLSKKFLGVKSGKGLIENYMKGVKTLSSSAAGVFVHGIEDEFHEVRESACRSLGMLAIASVQFANKATNLLMDMLNDDAEDVRLQTLQTLRHMATFDHLTMQDKHMHMFLVLLIDTNTLIRCNARKLLQLIKLPDLATFRETIGSLIRNLEMFPQEEEDIFFVLFSVGKNHKKFSAKLANEFAKEIDISCAELFLDSPGVAAKLVLFISSSFSNGQCTTDIPKALFSYAVPFSGRIVYAFRGAISQESLLAYLYSQSKEAIKISNSSTLVNLLCDVTCSRNKLDLDELLSLLEQPQDKGDLLNEEIMQSIKLNLEKVGEAWSLIKSDRAHEVRELLRDCEEELEIISRNTGPAGAFLDFATLYIKAVQLISEIWDKFQPNRFRVFSMKAFDIILDKLDMNLRRLRYGFPGLQRQEEYHILELTLLSYVFRLPKVRTSPQTILIRLTSIVSRLEFFCEGSSSLSAFAKEVKHVCTEGTTPAFTDPCVLHKLLKLFYPEKITCSGRIKLKKAELLSAGTDSENPLTFVSGLPVGIPFDITLYDILDSDKLWLRMVNGESIQHVFLDLCQFECSGAVRKFSFSVPFYGTPKAASFMLKTFVVMECPSDDITIQKKCKGVLFGDFAIICEEKYVHFINANSR